MKTILSLAFAVATGVALADPTPPIRPSVCDVKMTQDAASGVATIEYRITDMEAITTFDVLTNGVSVGDAAINCLVGDINKEVDVGKHTFIWRPEKSFPGHLFTEGNVKAVVKAWSTKEPPDYIVFYLDCLDASWQVRYYTSEAALPDGGLANLKYRNTRLVMRRIPAVDATFNEPFKMGSPESEVGRNCHRLYETQHDVTLTKDYYIGIYELTENQYAYLTGSGAETSADGLPLSADGMPLLKTSFATLRGTTKWWPNDKHEVDDGCAIAKMRAKFDNKFAFDLPTEAQWEFACRAGTTGSFYLPGQLKTNDDEKNETLDKIAWYSHNWGKSPTTVGQLEANAFGLYDMLGNAYEMCLDQVQDATTSWDYSSEPATDPVGYGDAKTGFCVARSCSSWMGPRMQRCAFRSPVDKTKADAERGFRLCFQLP